MGNEVMPNMWRDEDGWPPDRIAVRRQRALDEWEVSAREYDVLLLIVEGLINREIGKRLFISEETVKTHVRRLFWKLDVRNRAHLVAQAFRRGLIAY
jgi:DNA-binding CsgD family transcriptional regulator